MPLNKFRSIEEAEKALLLDPERGTAKSLRRFFDFTLMLKSITPHKPFPRGVTRYRSLEEKEILEREEELKHREDLHDFAVVAERKDESTYSLKEFKKKLKEK